MNHFVDYEPGRIRFGDILPGGAPAIRAACPSDVDGLARVMAARHGSLEEHAERARDLVGTLPRRGIAARLLREVLRMVSLEAPGEPIFSVINAQNLASIDLHADLGFREVARASTLARIEFTGGEGILLGYP